ncbi:FtsH protease activity modulator HflK [Alphaproteobacteria bacterium]|nr:FtsH protease activity modulator HflK [Alphaproteobacteria bacterium]
MNKTINKIFSLDGPWGQSPGGGSNNSGGYKNPESIDDLIKDLKNKYKFKMPFKGGAKGISFLILIAIILWLLTGFYRVEPDEQGVELLFGKWNESTTSPGLHYFFPTPIGKVLTPKVEAIRKINVGFRSNGDLTRDVLEESLMLTSDQNISDLDYTVLFRVKDAGQFLFNLRNPEETVKVISESVLREVVGKTRLEDLLTVSRQSVERESRSLLQDLLDEYQAGILIQSIQLQDVNPPREVIDAFDDVQKARQDKEKTVNQAEAYSNTIVPEARGKAEKILQQAEGYKNKLIKQAEGEASRFLQVLETYQSAKATTKKRIYLETMRDVFSNSNKFMIDNESGNGVVPYLPLNELTKNKNSESQNEN